MDADSTAAEAQVATDAMDADDTTAAAAEPAAAAAPAAAPAEPPVAAVAASPALALFADQATYTPMWLDMTERRYFHLLEATLGVSDYTDKVDILSWRKRDGRVLQQVKDICSILSGLVVAQARPPRMHARMVVHMHAGGERSPRPCPAPQSSVATVPTVRAPAREAVSDRQRCAMQDYRKGQELIKGRDFKANAPFFRDVFEVGRRYKIMNPDRMRGTYGKLMYMLMDTAAEQIEELLEFSCIKCGARACMHATQRTSARAGRRSPALAARLRPCALSVRCLCVVCALSVRCLCAAHCSAAQSALGHATALHHSASSAPVATLWPHSTASPAQRPRCSAASVGASATAAVQRSLHCSVGAPPAASSMRRSECRH
jgi:Protein of unknown function (DUF2009)